MKKYERPNVKIMILFFSLICLKKKENFHRYGLFLNGFLFLSGFSVFFCVRAEKVYALITSWR